MRPLRVLYLHMIGPFGGASRSLFEAIRALPHGTVEALFVAQRGSALAFFSQVGEVESAAGLTKFDHTRYSHYRGLRWLVLLRELTYLPATIAALHRARRRWRSVDLIHLNEFTGVLALWYARRLLGAPAVIHVRSVVHDEPRLLRTRWLHRMLRDQAAAVVAIDETVRASLPRSLDVDVIHNAFAPDRAAASDHALEGKLATLRPESFKVGFVGNLLLVKGILDLVDAAALLQKRQVDVEFMIVGDNAAATARWQATLLRRFGLAQNMRDEVLSRIERYSLRSRFHLLGFTTEIALVYRRMDVLCFPSHYDAPGRPIFEAAFLGVPSIVAVRQPRDDTLVDGVTGLAVPPGAPADLADAIERLARDRPATRRMGEAARAMAHDNFDGVRNARRLLEVYRRVCPRMARSTSC